MESSLQGRLEASKEREIESCECVREAEWYVPSRRDMEMRRGAGSAHRRLAASKERWMDEEGAER